MELFLKLLAGIMLGVILCLLLPKEKIDFSVLLCMAVCAMATMGIGAYVSTLLDFLKRLIQLGNLPSAHLETMIKIVGIGLLSQISTMVCTDAGKQSLAKILQLTTTVVVLYLCLPLLEQMLSIIETILGAK